MIEDWSAVRGKDVLLVDDDEDFRSIVARGLERAGIAVDQVDCTARAFERCAVRVPDLILMDVWMPGQSGIQACSLFRESRLTGAVPIILMSAQWRDEAQLMRALDAGANDVLAKERAGFEVLPRVRSALTLAALRSQLHSTERKLEELRHFIAICAGCKQVRNEAGDWEEIELYLKRATERELTHGICPTCRDRLYGANLLRD